MIELPNVTVVIVDTLNYGTAMNAIQKTLKQIKPARTIFFTDIEMEMDGVEIVKIKHMYSKKNYSDFMMKELGQLVIFKTTHILVIQHDGYVLDGEQWDDAFLNYDYIGAPWLESDGHNVGNGGFSLRSTKLCAILAGDNTITGIQPEDVGICRIYRNYLEEKYEMKFAPEALAHKFSYELHEPKDKTFGFHGAFHTPFKEPVVIKRTGALGDVIQVEPILEYFHKKGHPVYLDTQPGFLQLFHLHPFKVGDYSRFDHTQIKHRYINLDLAYETKPAQLHLKSYFEACGIKDYELRNPFLKYEINEHNKIFPQKYVVIHIDERETPHRNINGVDWDIVRKQLEREGYLVFQIGKGFAEIAGIRFNTVNEMMMLWLIAGCDIFIGVDSGPSHIAVATDRKCVLFFGSVNPHFIHYNMSKVIPIQSVCPIQKDHCWHSTASVCGSDCEVNVEFPPCCEVPTDKVLKAISQHIA